MVTIVLLMLIFTTLGIYQGTAEDHREFYSSVMNMELLLNSELVILDRLDLAIKQSEEKLKFFKVERDRFRVDIIGAAENPITFVSNPIRAFLMTKRLVRDYRGIDDLLRKGFDLLDDSTVLPTEDDLKGIAEGLSRLQDLYRMEASELAKGNVYGHKKVRMLTSDECHRIGVAMAQGKHFANACQWLREALKRWKGKDAAGVSKFEILDFFSYCLSEVGEYEEAMEITNQMLTLDPTNEGVLTKKKIIQDWLDELNLQKEEPQHFVSHRLYEPLCRGDYQRPATVASQLYCQYQTSTPFLRYAPLKQELLNLDPPVVMYHDVVSDKETAKIIDLAKSRINRATVYDVRNQQVSSARISQNAWLQDEEHPAVEAITIKTQDITGGLKVRSYEELQVNNYGIGGHYVEHYDYSMEAVPYEGWNIGNRIATVMFYLTDVEKGGATVFTRLGLAVRPKRGSAILWYNLLRNGNGDWRTLHAACPVLSGSKWVANMWIHEYHQEFVRPCDQDPEK